MNAIVRRLLKFCVRMARPYLRAFGLLQTAKVFNRSALVWEPGAEKVVVLAPHMDDEVIGCGGALARHVACGADVSVVFLTDGSLGGDTSGPGGAAELTATRRREAASALQLIGIDRMSFLDGRDGALESTPALAAALRRILLEQRPQLVYLPCFLEEHPDHRAATRLLLDAAATTDLDFHCLAYEVWTPLFPNCLVRIDDVVACKQAAIEVYRSQLAEADYVHTQLGLNAYRSAALLGGTCRYAEAYLSVSLAEYGELYRQYAAA